MVYLELGPNYSISPRIHSRFSSMKEELPLVGLLQKIEKNGVEVKGKRIRKKGSMDLQALQLTMLLQTPMKEHTSRSKKKRFD
jgi:hypothetical protein